MILKSTVNEELAMRNAIVIELLWKFYLIWRLMNYKVLYIKYITFTKQFFFLMSLNILMYLCTLSGLIFTQDLISQIWAILSFLQRFNYAEFFNFCFRRKSKFKIICVDLISRTAKFWTFLSDLVSYFQIHEN